MERHPNRLGHEASRLDRFSKDALKKSYASACVAGARSYDAVTRDPFSRGDLPLQAVGGLGG